MRLRGSSAEVNLQAVISREAVDPGIPLGQELHRLTLAVLKGGVHEARAAADAIAAGSGLPALIDAAGVLAFFNGINRVADATGIELEKHAEIPPELDLSWMRRPD
jgi:hypothetical protein